MSFQLTQLFDLTGRIALITGSSRGLGYTFAEGLARAGATVILNGQNQDRLQLAVKEMADKGHTVHSANFNVTDEEQIREQVHWIETTVGPIDILLNNAGINHRQPFIDFDAAAWRNVIDINLTGVFLTSKAVIPSMIKRESGKIINTASLMSETSRKGIPAYVASKGGIRQLTKAMAAEFAEHNIQVNAIAPGFFSTEMTLPLVNDPDFNAWICARTPAGRWGNPEELIGLAVFLASSASSYTTGQTIFVDGGTLATM